MSNIIETVGIVKDVIIIFIGVLLSIFDDFYIIDK